MRDQPLPWCPRFDGVVHQDDVSAPDADIVVKDDGRRCGAPRSVGAGDVVHGDIKAQRPDDIGGKQHAARHHGDHHRLRESLVEPFGDDLDAERNVLGI